MSFPSPGDLPDPGIELVSPALAGRLFNHYATKEANLIITYVTHICNLSYVSNRQCYLELTCLGEKKINPLGKVKVTQSRLTLCNPMDCSPPGSSVHRIHHARILEWVAISFSGGSSQPRDGICISYISCIGRWVLYY